MGKLETTKLKKEELLVLELLSNALGNKAVIREEALLEVDWEKFFQIAQGHRVTSFLYDILEQKKDLPPSCRSILTGEARKAVKQSYHLLFLCKYLWGALKEAKIPVVLLKGVVTASFYPVPELRKSGDVDLLLLEESKLKEACEVLQNAGCTIRKEQPALHHVVLESPEGIEIELHTMLAEPFDNERINQFLMKQIPACFKEAEEKEVMGVALPMLKPAYHAYELLLHMLQHFLRAGFGLKLLCDWVVFWNQDIQEAEKDKYIALVKESGLKGFSDMISQVCIQYLGMNSKVADWMKFEKEYPLEEFLLEIFDAEEFGNNSNARMVRLRENNLLGYVREFHHQMHLNFPKAGKVFLFWPVLWLATLIRFVRNNRRIRRVSTKEVLKNARKRSRLIGELDLWRR